MGVLVMCIRGTVLCLRFFLTLTEVFPCFFLSCKANARVQLAETGHGPHSSTLVVICVVRLLFVLFYALFVCKCVLPPGDNPTAVNKYISHHIVTFEDSPSSNLLTTFHRLLQSVWYYVELNFPSYRCTEIRKHNYSTQNGHILISICKTNGKIICGLSKITIPTAESWI